MSELIKEANSLIDHYMYTEQFQLADLIQRMRDELSPASLNQNEMIEKENTNDNI